MPGHFLPVFHLCAVVSFVGGLYYNVVHVRMPDTDAFKAYHAYGGLLKYLTIWNAIIQAFFFSVCLLNDFIGTNEIQPKAAPLIRRFKDQFFCRIAFPLSAFVAVTFWGLYAIDRELVLPKAVDLFFPTWLNHVMHTNILIFTLVELVCSYRRYPSRKTGLLTLTGFMLVYLVWTFVIYFKSGEWVYPVMRVLTWPQRIAFFLGLLLLVQSFYLAGEVMNKVVWSSELSQLQSNVRKQSTKKKAY